MSREFQSTWNVLWSDSVRIFPQNTGTAFKSFFTDIVEVGDTVVIPDECDWSDLASPIILNKDCRIIGIPNRVEITGSATKNCFDVRANVSVIGIRFDTWDNVFDFNSNAAALEQFRLLSCEFNNCDTAINENNGNGCEFIEVSGCNATSLHFRFISWLDGTFDTFTINGCRINNCDGGMGVRIGTNDKAQTANMLNAAVNNCDIRDIYRDTTGETHAILLYAENAIITDNYVKDVYNTNDGTAAEGIYTKVTGGIIGNNVVVNGGDYNSEGAINAKGGTRDSTNSPGSTMNVIGNTVIQEDSWKTAGHGGFAGIHLACEQANCVGNTVEGCEKGISVNASAYDDIHITNNMIYNCYGTAINCPSAGNGVNISRNVVRVTTDITVDASFKAIDLLNRDGDNTIIEGNIIHIDNPDGGGGGESGGIIIKNADGDYWIIRNNIIYAKTGNATVSGQDGYGIRILGGTQQHVDIEGNRITGYGSGDAPFHTNLSDQAVADNYIRIGRNPGYDNAELEFPQDDTSPNVGGWNMQLFKENYTGAAGNVTAFDNGENGQVITIIGSTGNFTLANSGTLSLLTSPTTLASGQVIRLQRINGVWYEI